MGMKTTVEISDPLFEAAKRESERSGVTLRELIESGLRRVLDEREQARSKPFKPRDASVGGGWLAPGLRDDPRALKWYGRMGIPGCPETVEEIHAMLDEEDAKERSKP